MKYFFHGILFSLFCLTGLQPVYTQTNIDSLEVALQIEKNPVEKTIILLSLTKEFMSVNQEKALEYANEALEYSVKSGYREGELRSLNFLGELYKDKTEITKAMDCAIKAETLAEQLDNPLQKLSAIYTLGNIYAKLGNFEKSSEIYYKCLRLNEDINDPVLNVRILNSFGYVNHNLNNYDKALDFYFKALNKSKEIGYSEGIAKGLNNVAAIYGIKGDNQKVSKYLSEAIALNIKEHKDESLAMNFHNLGYNFQVLKEYDSALYYLNKSYELYQKLNDAASVIYSKTALAEFYFEVGDTEKCKEIAEESLKGARQYGLKRYLLSSSELLSKVYFLENDSLKGYKYQVLALLMKDSINIKKSQTKLSALEQQYELDSIAQKRQIAQKRRNLIVIILVTSLIFIIIIIILMLSRMRIKARSVELENDKLEMSLELRNKELTSNVMSIMKKNNSLWQIARKLKSIQKEAVKDETKMAIRKITKELNKAAKDEQWEEFELRFNQTHSDFYDNLLDKYPKLTPQELRLCAFLRLNMTTKEISELTGQRTSTIEMARTRLRKKLNITNTQTNLVAFLTKI